jgi:ABC-type molybdate transport system substrate-binding protein
MHRKSGLSAIEANEKSIISLVAAVALVLGISSGARAQSEIALPSPNPIKETIDQLVADFEAKTGNTVKITCGTGVGTRKRVAEGGALDVTLLFAPFDDALKNRQRRQKQRDGGCETPLGNRG